ncbi:hypothetical protein ACGFYP_07460 [Streptomyces sp. NPDC048370]|uniref:hypothetical protein n=1 Tax=Streptomyces sp. NPDC048370 TaxID=3365540 RepID=UPI003715ED67
MPTFTPPPTGDQFHEAYWRAREALDGERAARRAEEQRDAYERDHPVQSGQ